MTREYCDVCGHELSFDKRYRLKMGAIGAFDQPYIDPYGIYWSEMCDTCFEQLRETLIAYRRDKSEARV